ncbi:queuosine salvage protein isoform X1 [Cimex lectularius]|uniref:Queuosine 5'-phosphate N-glycosylase/hydrolase n=1 Tax=Cimex lectularius TaxID=79782 RepID=A0A8I6TK16_CIMLE|nr:queuosine salvage protein isoform X1 [Cimex lectularius]
MDVLDPRDSCDFIAKMSKNVKIHPEKIRPFTEHLLEALIEKELRLGSIKEHETFPVLNADDSINLVFLLDTLNFCFWTKKNEEKWSVDFEGKTYTGYYALCAAVANAIKENIKIYDPKVYSAFTLDIVRKLFKGRGGKDINLPGHRLKCLQEVGRVLLHKYDGGFANCVRLANRSSERLLNLVVRDFPCFNDSARYRGKIVSIHKRAQILVADIWSLYYGKGISEFTDIDYITMFADYRIPQVLVHFGVMSYSDQLQQKLEKEELLLNGSEEEVEIRGCSIKIVEMLLSDLKQLMEEKGNYYYCNSIMIDNYLWMYRRKEADKLESTPFHKTSSIYY